MKNFLHDLFLRFAFGRIYYGFTDSHVSGMRQHEKSGPFQRLLWPRHTEAK